MIMKDFAQVDKNRKVAVNVRDIPADLRNRFKSYCAKNEMSMSREIIAFMERTVGLIDSEISKP